MTFGHNIITHAKAQAGALTGGFGGEEGLEDLITDVVRDPGSVVNHLNGY